MPTISSKVKLDKVKSLKSHQRFLEQIINLQLEEHVSTEFRFHETRRWRFDFAWPKAKIAFEIEGGLYMRNGEGHRSIKGMMKDIEKYNAAAFHGWLLFRVTPNEVWRGKARDLVRAVFESQEVNVE